MPSPQILENLLLNSIRGWADYAHQITVGNPGFSDLVEPETLNQYFDNFVGLILSSDENVTKKS